MMDHIEKHCRAGFFIGNATGVTIQGVTLTGVVGKAFSFSAVEGLEQK